LLRRKRLFEESTMRKYALLVVPLLALAVLQAPAQSDKAKAPYKVDFDPDRDVQQLDRSADGKEGIHIKVRFTITLEGSAVDKLEGDYKLVIEENGQRVKVVDVPRPVLSDALSVILAMDTSGSMKEHKRMEQARAAADVFLNKLPARTDCGLILFDHEIRKKMATTLEREPLLKSIRETEPRGGTAYLDAASKGVEMLRAIRGRDRAVVLMTDGIDLNSKKTLDQVIAEAKKDDKIDVRIYTIGIGEPGNLEQVNTVLVLDHSGSMLPPADDLDTTPKIVALHLAAERYVESMSPVGRVSIIPFSTLVGAPRPFRDKSQLNILKASIKTLKPSGETALFDACLDAINVLEADNARGKRAVVAMTDGFDNTSRRRVEEVIDRAREAKIPLYLIGFGRASEIDDATMRNMAESTGGKYYHATNKNKLIEIFESVSSDLHDDGIDEASLKKIASQTGGQYYLAKNVSELKMILEKVTQNIQRESHEIVYKSLNQRADGSQRNVTLKLIQRSGSGGDTEEVLDTQTGSYQMRGLVVAEMNHVVYLALLIVIGGLIALPAFLRRSTAA
jgi:VWFA-related protein